MMSFKTNPYSYGENAQETNTPVVTIGLSKGAAGEPIELDSSHDPIEASIRTGLPKHIPTKQSFSPEKGAAHSFKILDTNYAMRLAFELDTTQASHNLITLCPLLG